MALGGKRGRGFLSDPEPDLGVGMGIKGSQKLVLIPFPSHCFISLLLSQFISTVFMFSDGRTEAGHLALGFRDVYASD